MPKDTLLRWIEEMQLILSTVARAESNGDLPAARKEIDAACLRYVGLPSSEVKKSSPENLWELLGLGSDNISRAVILSELLLAQADMYRREGSLMEECRDRAQAFYLLSRSVPFLAESEQVKYRAKLARVREFLSTFEKDPYIAKLLSA